LKVWWQIFPTVNVAKSEATVAKFRKILLITISYPVLWHCWLGGKKGIRPVKNRVLRCWRGYLSGGRCKWFAYGPADATATPSSLAPVKSRMVYLSGAGLPRLFWEKGPLNGYSSSSSYY